jgi:hypothetical protein
MHRYISNRYGILLFIIATLISCKSTKQVIPLQKKKSVSDIISSTQSYKSYEAKAKIKYSSPEESIKGILNLRLRRDSAMLMAVKKLGVEGARTLITQDSVVHIDRINRNYYIKSIDEYSHQGISVSFNYAQLLLTASMPLVTRENIIDSSYTDNHIVIKTMINEMLHELRYDIYTGFLVEASFIDRFGLTGRWSYAEYKLIQEDVYFPYSRQYEIESSTNENLILELDFSNIAINVSKPVDINIPHSYNRIY